MMTLVEEAERAEKIRNAFVVFTGPCAEHVTSINKAISELSSLSCVLREMDRLIDLDEGPGLKLIQDDLRSVHDDVTFTLGDIWQSLGCLGQGHTVQDYQITWDEITEQAEETSGGRTLHKTIEGYKRFMESLCKTMESHIVTPTVENMRPHIQGIGARRVRPQPPTQRSSSRSVSRAASVKTKGSPTFTRSNSTRRSSPTATRDTALKVNPPQSPVLKKSYERERPMSPTESNASSITEGTTFRDKPWVPSPPLSPAATMSSISAVSSVASTEVTSKHWARYILDNIPSTTLPRSKEETRYHNQRGTKEHSHPNQAYEPVLNLFYPDGIRISLFCRPKDYRAKIVATYRDQDGKPDYGCLPLEDLILLREGSMLRLCRQRSSGKTVPWVSIKFPTVERMILFASTFISMRSQDSVAQAPPPIHDDIMRDEECQYAGSIIDSGFSHGLRVFTDKVTGVIRLQASVLHGELDRTPVWTAFITHDIETPGWHRPVDRRTVALAKLKPYIFSSRYRPQLTPSEGFMLRFESRDDAEAFLEVMDSISGDVGRY